MKASGGQPGNKNPASKRIWSAAIQRALAKRGASMGEALDELADHLIDLCQQKKLDALKELGDRLEGKAIQSEEIEHSGEIGLREIRNTIVDPHAG